MEKHSGYTCINCITSYWTPRAALATIDIKAKRYKDVREERIKVRVFSIPLMKFWKCVKMTIMIIEMMMMMMMIKISARLVPQQVLPELCYLTPL